MANGSQKTSFPQQDPFFSGKSPKTSKNAKICPLCKPQNPRVIVGIEPSHHYHTLLGLLGTPTLGDLGDLGDAARGEAVCGVCGVAAPAVSSSELCRARAGESAATPGAPAITQCDPLIEHGICVDH